MRKIGLMLLFLVFSGCTLRINCSAGSNQSTNLGALYVEITHYGEFNMKKIIGKQLYVKNRWVRTDIENAVNEDKFCDEFVAPSEILKLRQCFVGERLFVDSTGKIAFECIAKTDLECAGDDSFMPKDSIISYSIVRKTIDDFAGFVSLDSLKMDLPLESPKYKALKNGYGH